MVLWVICFWDVHGASVPGRPFDPTCSRLPRSLAALGITWFSTTALMPLEWCRRLHHSVSVPAVSDRCGWLLPFWREMSASSLFWKRRGAGVTTLQFYMRS